MKERIRGREVLRRKCPGLKHDTEAVDLPLWQVVEEHS